MSMSDFVDESMDDLDINAILYSDEEYDTEADIFSAVRDPEEVRRNAPELATGISGMNGAIRSGGDACQVSPAPNPNT